MDRWLIGALVSAPPGHHTDPSNRPRAHQREQNVHAPADLNLSPRLVRNEPLNTTQEDASLFGPLRVRRGATLALKSNVSGTENCRRAFTVDPARSVPKHFKLSRIVWKDVAKQRTVCQLLTSDATRDETRLDGVKQKTRKKRQLTLYSSANMSASGANMSGFFALLWSSSASASSACGTPLSSVDFLTSPSASVVGVLVTTMGESNDMLDMLGVLIESSSAPERPSFRISLNGDDVPDSGFHDWFESSPADTAPSFWEAQRKTVSRKTYHVSFVIRKSTPEVWCALSNGCPPNRHIQVKKTIHKRLRAPWEVPLAASVAVRWSCPRPPRRRIQYLPEVCKKEKQESKSRDRIQVPHNCWSYQRRKQTITNIFEQSLDVDLTTPSLGPYLMADISKLAIWKDQAKGLRIAENSN